jgi:hypothetical protein
MLPIALGSQWNNTAARYRLSVSSEMEMHTRGNQILFPAVGKAAFFCGTT